MATKKKVVKPAAKKPSAKKPAAKKPAAKTEAAAKKVIKRVPPRRPTCVVSRTRSA